VEGVCGGLGVISREGGHLGLGISIGICLATIALLALDLVKLPFAFTDGIIGAIVGGLIAGGVAIAGQVLVILAELNVLEKADLKERRTAAQGIFLKCHTIHDYTRKAHNYYRTFDLTSVVGMQTRDSSGGLSAQRYLWKPLRSRKNPVRFEDREKQFALDVKNSELLNLLNDLENSFELLLFIEIDYTQKFDAFQLTHIRQNFRSIAGKHVQSEGAINPLDIMELEDFLTHLRNLSISALKHVSNATAKVTEILSKEHKLKIELKEDLDAGGAVYND
jgi:hypothetical protein